MKKRMKSVLSFWCMGLGLLLAQSGLAAEPNYFAGQPIQPSWIKGQTPPGMYRGSPKHNGELETASRTQASLAGLAPGDYTTTFSVPAAGNYAAVSTTAGFTVYPESEKPAYEYEWVEFPSANVHGAFDTGVRFNHRTTKLELKYKKTDNRYGMYLTASDDDDVLGYSTRLFVHGLDGFIVCQPNNNNLTIDESGTARTDRDARVITLTGSDVTYKGVTMAYKSPLADADTTDTLWIGTGDRFGGVNRSPYYGIGHRFYYLKMWNVGSEGETLVHHWVPVKTMSGATMLYDKVTDRLLPPFAIPGSTLTLGGVATPMEGQPGAFDPPTQTSPAADAVLATQNAMHKEFYAKSMANRGIIASATGWSANTGNYGEGAKYRLRMFNEGGCCPVQTRFSWTGNGPFTLEIRRAADRSLFYRQENIAGPSVLVDNLEVGMAYLWSVGNANGFSPWRAFSTETAVPRFLCGCSSIPCVTSMGKTGKNQYEAVTNQTPHGVRDLGGYVGRDGRRVRQGLAIRTSEFDGEKGTDVAGVSFVTDENVRFWRDFLGIKTDIDLRNGAEWNQASSPLADAEHPVAWKNFASFPKNGGDLASSTARNNLRDAIRLFADRGNYPLAFHGVHGKGRTGCLSYMILGLLGVSQNDLHKDFEGTLFWHPYQTDADLTSLDEYIMGNALASPGTTLNERIESFVRNIGVTASDISAIREIMLDQAPSANEVWAVLGDGYSAFDGHPGVTNPRYPTGDVTTEDQTWWSQVVAHFSGEVGKVVAAASSRISGEATDGGVAIASFYDRAKNGELGNPDHLLVMGGLNDWWGGIPDGEVFANACELFDLLDTRYAKARKIVVLPKRPGSDDVGLPSVYRSALKQAARDHGYTVVDLDGAYTETATDIEGGHPNASGMAKIAGRVIASLEGTYAPPTHVHQYGEWVTTVPATETTAGERMRTCEADGCSYPLATEVERLPPTGDPDTYDYLLSDGVGYLPTDWRLTPTTRVELEFKLMADQEDKTGSCQSFFWLDDATGTEWGCTQWSKGGGIGYYYDVGDMEISGGLSDTVNRYVISAGGTNAFLAATSHAISTVGAQALPHERIILFASRNRETHRIQYPARIKLYSFKVWDDAVSATDPVRNYVPVMDANGVATLYDEVTRTYLDAPVGGTFEVGNDTDDPVVVTKVAKPTLAAIWAGRDGENHCPSVAVTPAGAYMVEYSNGGNWTAVGDYTATCRLADTARYAWADGTTDDVVLPFAVIDRYDYLESDGHGYLLTDYPFDIAKTHVEMKFQTMIDQEDKPYANQSFFWIDNATSGDEWGCTQWGKGGSIGYYYNSGEASVTDALPDFDNTHTIRAWGNTVQLDGRAPVSGSAPAPASLPRVNVMLFASRDWATQEVHYEARIRIDSFKIWEYDETNPVRNYVAVKRADGSSTFFDTVTGVYLDPSTGGFIAGNREQKADVGRFILTDGKGYFDLGFKPHLRNTRIEIVSTLDPNQGGQGILWAGSSKVMGLCADPNDGTITYYATRVGGSGEGDGVSRPDSCHMGDTMVHTMTVGGRSFVVDGVETPCGYETADAEADGNAILFLNGSQGAPAVKLYSVRVWDVSRTPAALVHSFVPGTSADQLYDEVGGTSVTAKRVTDGAAYSFQLGQDAMIDLPTLTRTTFDYDNTEKRPLPESETFTLFGDVAKSAPGTYTVRVVPNGGYCWTDGSHAARTIEWTINGSWNPIATDFGISNRITVAEQDYCILTFTNTAAAGWSWTVPADVAEFEFLVAAGGGGGGAGNGWADDCRTGGGGGAGGVVAGRVANASGTFTVRVGAGGATGAEPGASGENGGDSSLKLGGVNYVTAKGGGAGGGARYAGATDTGSDGAAGGSGGGGSAKDNQRTTAGGAMAAAEVGGGVTEYQMFGNAGGSGYGKSYAGGGGGACGAGESASAANAKNGEGGAGLVSPISGELATYGRGGGTAYRGAAGDGAAAAVATGNGGAGGYGDGDGVGFYGEAGGSGVVVIRYATSALPPPPPEVDTYDWLLADGNGYIETDYVPNLQKTRIEVVYEQTSHDSGFFWMANACTAPGGSGSGRQMYSLSFGLHGDAGEELRYGRSYGGDEHEVLYGTPERYVVVTNVTQGADVWRNGVHAAMPDYTANDVWASGPLVLFAGNWAGRYADGKKAMLKAKVYRVTISEVDGGTAEIRYNFVPAMDAYGRATMYDTISGQFADVLGDEAGYTVGNGYPTNPGPGPTPDPTATVAPVAVAPECGAMVDILTPMQRRFLAKSAEERRADFMSQAQRRNLCSLDYGFCNPQPITLRWEGAGTGSVGRCTVRVWRVKDGEETLHSIQEVLGDSTTVDNFEVAADYRWEVSNAIGTAGGTFTTRDETPRLLRDPDPRQRITGIRDLGGRIGLDGRRVKQNLVFRSSRLNAPESEDESFITDANRSWWRDTLKIRTDLDLRSNTEVGVWKTTPIPDAAWKHVSANSYANFVKYPAAFKNCFNLFLDANNYPFVFHGEAGQDRTGCLAFVLEALLGVDEDECLKDWEANAFRNGDVTWNHEAGIDKFIAAFDGEAGDTLTERIVSWVKRQGYSDDDIKRFRELMLEPAAQPSCVVTIGDHAHLAVAWTSGDGSVTNEVDGDSFPVPGGTTNVCVIFTAESGWEIVGDAVVELGTVTEDITFGPEGGFLVPTVRHEPVEYVDADGVARTKAAGEFDVVMEETRFLTNGWYVVEDDVDIAAKTNIVVQGDVHLILCDGASLTVTNAAAWTAAVAVEDGASLSIYGQANGTGRLTAKGGNRAAGIGCAHQKDCGTISIHGGVVTATGGSYGAGIGSSSSCSNGCVVVTGGRIAAAKGNIQGSDIGNGGGKTTGCEVSISGGLFANPVDVAWCAEGYAPVANPDPNTAANYPYTVRPAYRVTVGEHPNVTVAWTCGDKSVTNEIEGVSFGVMPPGTNDVTVIFSATDSRCALDGESVVNIGAVTGDVVFGVDNDFAVPRSGVRYLDWDAGRNLATNAMVGVEDVTWVTTTTKKLADGKWYAVFGNFALMNSLPVEGSAHLILCDWATLAITNSTADAAISVGSGASLTIYGQTADTGRLAVSGGNAGIGGKTSGVCGAIAIHGGTISASAMSNKYCAGIGSGALGSGGSVTITGGRITAQGGTGAEDIGSGANAKSPCAVAISGGIFARPVQDAWLASDCSVITNQDAATVAAYPWAVVPYPAVWPAADDAVKAKFGAWRNGDGAEADLAAGAAQKAFLLNVAEDGIKELKIESIEVDEEGYATIVVSAPGAFFFDRVDLGNINGVLYVHAGDTLETMTPKAVAYWTTTNDKAMIKVKENFIRAAIGFKTPDAAADALQPEQGEAK